LIVALTSSETRLLFSSLPFIFVFLPLALAGYYLSAHYSRVAARGTLLLAAAAFYGLWNPGDAPILATSIVFNWLVSLRINPGFDGRPAPWARAWLAFGVAVDIAVLGYFKYSGFLVSQFAVVSRLPLTFTPPPLPLGISLFTFTQIAYLVDRLREYPSDPGLPGYALFVSYFPHLVAGPIIHHREVMPRFLQRETFRFSVSRLNLGLSLFVLGLAKKTLLADNLAGAANAVYAQADLGGSLTLIEAWMGTFCYAFQLYFDFSGYSDMALGLAALFGAPLPANFDSPYKAANIIDFWRRWHMTLSRFLRDYLYIPLGGNRRGETRRYANIFVTMALGGLWHGASWNFLLWGSFHGALLVANHLCRAVGPSAPRRTGVVAAASTLATFIFVLLGWVLFRAETLSGAITVYRAMFDPAGFVVPEPLMRWLGPGAAAVSALGGRTDEFAALGSLQFFQAGLGCVIAGGICWLLPNTVELFSRRSAVLMPSHMAAYAGRLVWSPSWPWAAVIGALAALSVAKMCVGAPSAFIYFRF
jgi:alginate O-acetyltransferase complex protein AlgI